MHFSKLSHLTDDALRREMIGALANERRAAALALAHLAEFDARKLYVPEGYPSMFRFCANRLGLSDAGASKRIQAARAAREFPAIWDLLAGGRLSVSAVCLLAPKLEPENADELLAAAAGRSKRALELCLANRFPKADVAMEVAPIEPAPEGSRSPGNVSMLAPAHPQGDGTAASRPRIAPLSPERYGVRFTMGQGTHEAIQAFEQLAGRKVTAEHMNEALRRGFEAMAAAIEKRRFAATDRPRKQQGPAKGRHIPAAVRREVRERDGDRCTFVADSGRRCGARGKLEFDHIEPVARGGKSTAANLRLRCRAHNQYEAEQAFGAGFMAARREASRRAADVRRPRPGQTSAPASRAKEPERPSSAEPPEGASAESERASGTAAGGPDPDLDVTPWLLRLGFRKTEARQAAARCEDMADASLERRLRAALSFLRPPARVEGAFRGAAQG